MFPKKYAVTISSLFSLFLFHNSFAVNNDIMAWKISELAKASIDTVPLEDKKGKVLKTINTKQIVYIYAIITGIEEAAEIHAEPLIVNGDDPNAFATVDKEGQNIIAINFGMLDMLGNDYDAIAALIGHELAHLKLKHGEESKKAMKKSNGNLFSASATKYSRDNEREADYLGVIWSIEAGYDPEGAVRLQEGLYKKYKYKVGGFSGSHPSSIERITVLKSLVRRLSRQ